MEKSLPKGWAETEFGNIISLIKNGGNFKQEDLQSENYYPVSRIETIWNEEIDLNRVKYAEITHSDLAKYLLKIGDILFSHINSDRHLGKTAIYKNDVQLIHGVNLLLLRTETGVMPDYVNYYLRDYRFKGGFLEIAQRSVNQSSINQKKLSSIPFPLPPLPEQERIVAKLDKLFAQHEKIKKALDRIPQLLKTFRQQVLTQAVTGKLTEQWREGKDLEEWDEKELQEVAKIVDPHPSHRTPPEFENGIPYISIGDIDANKKINFEKARKVNPNILREHISRYTLKFGDFIFGKIGTIGKPIKIPVVQNYCLSANVILIQPKEDLVLPQYVYIYLDSPYLLAKVMEKAVATSQAAYGIKKMRVELISIPPKEEQKEIVHRVESLFAKADTIEARYHLLKAKIDSLPQAILHKAFKGELVPQLPTDGDAKDLLAEIMALKEEVKGRKKK